MKREFIYSDNWLELVFENRNRSYGAYLLRKRLADNTLIGWIITTVIFVSIFFILFAVNKSSVEKIIEKNLGESVIVEYTKELFSIPDKPETNPTKPAQQNPPVKNANLPPVVTNLTLVDTASTEADNTGNINQDNLTVSNSNTDVSSSNSSSDAVTTVSRTTIPVRVPEIPPQFPGGEAALLKFIKKNTHYPAKFLGEGINGTVWVTFIVDTTGKVTNITAEKGIEGYPEFNKAAQESFYTMPLWTPGMQDKLKVPVIFTLPVKFTVNKGF